MKNAIRMISAVAMLLVASEAYSQAPAAPAFSLRLDVSPSSAKTGSDFLIAVDLINNTSQQVVMETCPNRAVECVFEIDVRDSQGKSVPRTKVLLWGTALLGVQPGHTCRFSSKLSELFDLSRPDRYEIQVAGWDSNAKKTVRSNVTHVVVVAE